MSKTHTLSKTPKNKNCDRLVKENIEGTFSQLSLSKRHRTFQEEIPTFLTIETKTLLVHEWKK